MKSLRDQPFMYEMLRAEATKIEPGLVEITVPIQDQLLQPHGNVHGIIASAVADSAAGYAAQTLLPEGYDVVTVEYKMNYMAPGVGEKIVAVGQVIRAGRTLSVCSADIFAETAGKTGRVRSPRHNHDGCPGQMKLKNMFWSCLFGAETPNKSFQPTRYSALFQCALIFTSPKRAVTGG